MRPMRRKRKRIMGGKKRQTTTALQSVQMEHQCERCGTKYQDIERLWAGQWLCISCYKNQWQEEIAAEKETSPRGTPLKGKARLNS